MDEPVVGREKLSLRIDGFLGGNPPPPGPLLTATATCIDEYANSRNKKRHNGVVQIMVG